MIHSMRQCLQPSVLFHTRQTGLAFFKSSHLHRCIQHPQLRFLANFNDKENLIQNLNGQRVDQEHDKWIDIESEVRVT